MTRWSYPDVLRGVAIIAMLIAHARRLVMHLPAWWDPIIGRINDVASPLFATVMGMAAAIMLASSASRRSVVWHNTVRGIVLIALAIWLAEWGSWIAIVLGQLGLVLWLGTPLLLLGTRAVAAIAVALTLVAAWLNQWVARSVSPELLYEWTPAGIAVQWFFTNGNYRFTNLLPYFLFGAILVSIGFARNPDRRRSGILLGIGLLAQVVGTVWRNASEVGPPSGSNPDTMHEAGLVLIVLGVFGLVAAAQNPWIESALAPVRTVGTVALSVYVFQIALVGWMNTSWNLDYTRNHWFAWTVLVVGVIAVGWVWARFVGRGPIEWFIGLVSGRYLPRRRASGTHR